MSEPDIVNRLIKTFAVIVVAVGFVTIVQAQEIDPAICWSKDKRAIRAVTVVVGREGLACWCKLKREFHSGPPGTDAWFVEPTRTQRRTN